MTPLLTLIAGIVLGGGVVLALAMKTERAAREAGRREGYDEARAYWFEAGKRAERSEREIHQALSGASRPRPLRVVRGGEA